VFYARYGKRTDVDAYRLQSRGGKGVINMKTSSKIGKVTSINLVDDTTDMMSSVTIRQDHQHRHQIRPQRRPQHLRLPSPQPRHRRQGSQRHRNPL
jgi:DNA gyrase/topoisomerase IV subunit A